jgi:hypothetical protein
MIEHKEVVAPVRAAFEALAGAEKGSVSYAIKLGDELVEARKKVKAERLGWENWMKEHLAGFMSARNVDNYILVAEHRHISQHAASIREALKQIGKDLIEKGEKTQRKKSAKAAVLDGAIKTHDPHWLGDQVLGDWKTDEVRKLIEVLQAGLVKKGDIQPETPKPLVPETTMRRI